MLKKILLVVIAIYGLSFTACSKTPNFKKLGTKKFTVEKWKTSSQEERGEILHSFFQQYDVLNKKPEFIKKLLGET